MVSVQASVRYGKTYFLALGARFVMKRSTNFLSRRSSENIIIEVTFLSFPVSLNNNCALFMSTYIFIIFMQPRINNII